jgi:pimeloyl-ACP methyl ester carboxylesterase
MNRTVLLPRLSVGLTLLAWVAISFPAFSQPAVEARTIQVNGIDLHYEIRGEGEPLVLLHSGTRTARMYDPFVETYATKYRVIVPDLRGHGGSTNPDGDWTTRSMAKDVFALLDHLGVERFKGIGTSAGAVTLLHMATQQPDRVEAMVVVGVGTYLPVECRKTLAATDADKMSAAGWDAYRKWHPGGDEQIRALFDWVASLADSYDDMTFTPAKLATIKARTLIVHGDRDYCFPSSMAQTIYEAIPNAYLWVVPNGGHVPITGSDAPIFESRTMAFLAGDWN